MNINWKQKSAALSCSVLALGVLTAALLVERTASAQATSTLEDITFNVFVPCADSGNGEFVEVVSTLHLIRRNGIVVHGNQVNGTGVGLITGDTYVISGSPANLVPAGDGEFLYHLGWIGTGRDAVKFNLTAKGPIQGEPLEILHFSCM